MVTSARAMTSRALDATVPGGSRRGRRRVRASTTRANASEEPKKLWGGRFSEAQDPLMEKFNESLSFDRRMWREDVDGSVGYAAALARAGVITGWLVPTTK